MTPLEREGALRIQEVLATVRERAREKAAALAEIYAAEGFPGNAHRLDRADPTQHSVLESITMLSAIKELRVGERDPQILATLHHLEKIELAKLEIANRMGWEESIDRTAHWANDH